VLDASRELRPLWWVRRRLLFNAVLVGAQADAFMGGQVMAWFTAAENTLFGMLFQWMLCSMYLLLANAAYWVLSRTVGRLVAKRAPRLAVGSYVVGTVVAALPFATLVVFEVVAVLRGR